MRPDTPRFLRLVARLVPRDRRRSWLLEWDAEVRAWRARGRPVLRAMLGAIPHAVSLRLQGVEQTADEAIRDLRVGARTLARRPMFTATAVATLAVGLGATTAVYSVVDRVLLAPLPYPGGDRFVKVTASFDDFQGLGVNQGFLVEWRTRARALETMESYRIRDVDLIGDGPPAAVREVQVTAGFLADLLAVAPVHGRLILDEENAGEGQPVALLSEALWRSRYGTDPDVLGRSIRLNDVPHEVIGVVPEVSILPEADVWTPLPLAFTFGPTGIELSGGTTLARRAPGVSLDDARRDLAAAAELTRASLPENWRGFEPGLSDYRSGLVADVRGNLLLLLGAVVAVLMIACVNVANLLLVRATERSAEMSVRAGLGASRGRLVRQVLTEGVLLAGAGGLAALGIAVVAVRGLLAMAPDEIPLADGFALDARVLVFATLATAGTALLFGLVPAFRTSGVSPGALATGRSSGGRRQRRSASLLLGLQVAQAAVLLAGALLMVHSLARLHAQNPGFDAEGLVYAHLRMPNYAFGARTDLSARTAFVEDVRAGVASLPGTRAAGVGTSTPFLGMTFMIGMELEGGRREGGRDPGLSVGTLPELAWFSQVRVTDGYLEALGLPVLRGRSIEAEDLALEREVAVVNRTAAEAYWPGEDPLGKRLRTGGRGADGEDEPWITVVGVVDDFEHPGLSTSAMAEFYRPFTAARGMGSEVANLLVRVEGDEEDALAAIRRQIWSLRPDLPIPALSTARRALGASLAGPGFYAALLGAFATLALLLAAVGIYGVTAHSVAARTREMGIRIALGAAPPQVRRQVLRESLAIVLPALAVGLAGAVALSDVIEGLLYGITPRDPRSYALSGVLLLAVAIAAVWVPATRATRADPARALRTE